MNVLELFAGAGGGIYGGLLLGHTPVCAVEIVAKNRELLLQRQRDGVFPRFPVWDDVRTFEGRPWRGVGWICYKFVMCWLCLWPMPDGEWFMRILAWAGWYADPGDER